MRAILVTGACGGLGEAVCGAFESAGWLVVGTDMARKPSVKCRGFVEFDLESLAIDDSSLNEFKTLVDVELRGHELTAIVNNAAVQILGATQDIRLTDWERTLRVNLTAPFRIIQKFLPELTASNGVVLNIGSVHAQATKNAFVSYATSKAALHGLTRALAVDLGGRVRVLCLAPAAVLTTMLAAGFEKNPDGLATLAEAHPIGRVASPAEVARAAVSLTTDAFLFATGTTFWLDGGVLSRLHDPV